MDEVAFRRLISGARRGTWPAAQRGVLSLLSLGYRLGVAANGLAYSLGIKPRRRVGVPVVSVGNLTAGGTGKTPCVAAIVEWFRVRGALPAILSRGYRADSSGTNDERLVLDRRCPGVPHLQDPNRVAAADRAIREHGADVLVLDDGFQHRRLDRDLDLVLIDALCPWGFGRLLPRGLLREPVAALRRADLVLLTRVDQCTPAEHEAILDRIEAVRGSREHVAVAFPPSGLVDHRGRLEPLASVAHERVLGVCGIGNPRAFRRTLAAAGVDVAEFLEFPDHHHFGEADRERIRAVAARHGCRRVLCTEKDLVKLPWDDADGVSLQAVRIDAEIVAGRELLERALARVDGLRPAVAHRSAAA